MQSSFGLAGAGQTAGTWSGCRDRRFRTSSSKTAFFLKVSPSVPNGCSFSWPRQGKSIKRVISVSDKARRENPVRLTPLFASSTGASESPSSSSDGAEGFLRRIQIFSDILSAGFPLWVALACGFGLYRPGSFAWINPNWQVVGLALSMLGMGMTLTLDDLRGALSMPKEIFSGFILQYTVMPLSGYFVSKLMRLPSHYAAGLILVACCPGGTASNIVTYLGRGNVALSVMMTAASTICAAVMTPFLTAKLAGQYVAVDAVGLFNSTLQVVLAPVLLGALLNQYCHWVVRVVSPVMPLIAITTVALLCGGAIAQNATSILMSGQQVVLAVCTLHASGFFFGYFLARMLGLDISSCRTISIEVGMQNSVLGVVLAGKHFSSPLTAVPCAVSSVCHSIYGSVLAGIWRLTTPAKIPED